MILNKGVIWRTFINTLKMPDLKFGFNELEPVFSARAIELHYKKHHQTYLDNYIKLYDEFWSHKEKENLPHLNWIGKLICFSQGGYMNHNLYWESLSPVNQNGGVLPS